MMLKITPLNTTDKAPTFCTTFKLMWALHRTYGFRNLKKIDAATDEMYLEYKDIPIMKIEPVESISNDVLPAT